jgi:hypothetical protein
MTKTATVHNLANIRRDRGYRFTDRDPDMVWLCNIISKSELSVYEICEATARVSKGMAKVSRTTIGKWLDGTTKRPQNYTLSWVSFALGYERNWKKIR